MDRVMVFVDGSNIYHGLKAYNQAHGHEMGRGVRIDYDKLVRVLVDGRGLRRAYFYGSYAQEGDPSWSFFETLSYGGFKVRAFPLRAVAQTYVEKGVDMNVTLDMMLHASRKHVDTVVLVSGSSDYLPLLETVQDMGVRVEIAAFRESTSPRLIKAADHYIDLEHRVPDVAIDSRARDHDDSRERGHDRERAYQSSDTY